MSKLATIDALCDEFKAAWSANARPDFASWLARIGQQHQSELIEQLVAIDVDLLNRAGRPVAAEEYAEFGDTLVAFAHK